MRPVVCLALSLLLASVLMAEAVSVEMRDLLHSSKVVVYQDCGSTRCEADPKTVLIRPYICDCLNNTHRLCGCVYYSQVQRAAPLQPGNPQRPFARSSSSVKPVIPEAINLATHCVPNTFMETPGNCQQDAVLGSCNGKEGIPCKTETTQRKLRVMKRVAKKRRSALKRIDRKSKRALKRLNRKRGRRSMALLEVESDQAPVLNQAPSGVVMTALESERAQQLLKKTNSPVRMVPQARVTVDSVVEQTTERQPVCPCLNECQKKCKCRPSGYQVCKLKLNLHANFTVMKVEKGNGPAGDLQASNVSHAAADLLYNKQLDILEQLVQQNLALDEDSHLTSEEMALKRDEAAIKREKSLLDAYLGTARESAVQLATRDDKYLRVLMQALSEQELDDAERDRIRQAIKLLATQLVNVEKQEDEVYGKLPGEHAHLRLKGQTEEVNRFCESYHCKKDSPWCEKAKKALSCVCVQQCEQGVRGAACRMQKQMERCLCRIECRSAACRARQLEAGCMEEPFPDPNETSGGICTHPCIKCPTTGTASSIADCLMKRNKCKEDQAKVNCWKERICSRICTMGPSGLECRQHRRLAGCALVPELFKKDIKRTANLPNKVPKARNSIRRNDVANEKLCIMKCRVGDEGAACRAQRVQACRLVRSARQREAKVAAEAEKIRRKGKAGLSIAGRIRNLEVNPASRAKAFHRMVNFMRRRIGRFPRAKMRQLFLRSLQFMRNRRYAAAIRNGLRRMSFKRIGGLLRQALSKPVFAQPMRLFGRVFRGAANLGRAAGRAIGTAARKVFGRLRSFVSRNAINKAGKRLASAFSRLKPGRALNKVGRKLGGLFRRKKRAVRRVAQNVGAAARQVGRKIGGAFRKIGGLFRRKKRRGGGGGGRRKKRRRWWR